MRWNFDIRMFAFSAEQISELKSRVDSSSHDVFIKDINSVGWWELDDLAYSIADVFSLIVATT